LRLVSQTGRWRNPALREGRLFVERMAVEIEGEGEPVVMIHGLGGTANTFTPLLAAFTRHRTIRFDLPGSGRSHRVEGPLSLPLFVERTLLVMRRAGVERAHVVAHSMGTIVCQHIAADHPKRVASKKRPDARDAYLVIARHNMAEAPESHPSARDELDEQIAQLERDVAAYGMADRVSQFMPDGGYGMKILLGNKAKDLQALYDQRDKLKGELKDGEPG